ncbi:MAG: PAS domain-containing protein [Planctomycetota bacterium]
MTDSNKTDSSGPKSLSVEVGRLFAKYFSNPQSPRLEEVGRLAEDIMFRNKELENKVSNLKKIIQQLEAYRDRYVDLYELAPVGYVTLDEEGYVQEINIAGVQLLGADRDDVIGFPFENYVQSQDRENLRNHLLCCCRENQVISFEVGVLAKDGKSITVQLRGVPLESLKGDETFCKIAITDITERKLAEEAIKASEANYRAIFDTANDAIFIHDADTGGFLDANSKASEMYGYNTEEFRQVSVDAISEGHPPYSQKEAVEWLQRAIAGMPQRFDWKARDKGGRLFWTAVNLTRTVFNGVPRILAIVRDITEQKEAVEALRANEEQFRTVADYTYDWEYWRGVDGRFRYVSPSCQRITGYSPEEFMADPALLERIVHPDDRDQLMRHFRSENPIPSHHAAEYRIISRTGEERWIEHICQPVYGVDQRWLGQRASNRDITDRKRSELELKQRIGALQK